LPATQVGAECIWGVGRFLDVFFVWSWSALRNKLEFVMECCELHIILRGLHATWRHSLFGLMAWQNKPPTNLFGDPIPQPFSLSHTNFPPSSYWISTTQNAGKWILFKRRPRSSSYPS
jgi:hypothetical protein